MDVVVRNAAGAHVEPEAFVEPALLRGPIGLAEAVAAP
jgi:hypothetical protein